MKCGLFNANSRLRDLRGIRDSRPQSSSLCADKKTKDLGSRVGTTLRLFKKVSLRTNLQREI